MTLAEKAAKLTELIRQMREIESAIMGSGLDEHLIKDALEDVSEASSELKASRHWVHKLQRELEQA
jgi:hypothetical protein